MEKEKGEIKEDWIMDWVIAKKYGIQALDEDNKTIEAFTIIDNAFEIIRKYCKRDRGNGG